TARIVTRRPSKRIRKASPPECDQKHSSRSSSPSIEKPRQTQFLRAKTKFLRERITFGFKDRICRRGRYITPPGAAYRDRETAGQSRYHRARPRCRGTRTEAANSVAGFPAARAQRVPCRLGRELRAGITAHRRAVRSGPADPGSLCQRHPDPLGGAVA